MNVSKKKLRMEKSDEMELYAITLGEINKGHLEASG